MNSRETLEERDRELAESNSAETRRRRQKPMDGADDWQSNLSKQQILGALRCFFCTWVLINNQPVFFSVHYLCCLY